MEDTDQLVQKVLRAVVEMPMTVVGEHEDFCCPFECSWTPDTIPTPHAEDCPITIARTVLARGPIPKGPATRPA
jgi:hypothetical protein